MFEVLKEIRARYALYRSSEPEQDDYLRSLATSCGRGAFISNMIQYDWFSWEIYCASSAACSSGTQGCAELRRARVWAAFLVLCSLVEQIVWIYLASSLEWDASLGRWYAIRTAKFELRIYWEFVARQAALLALASFFACAFPIERNGMLRDRSVDGSADYPRLFSSRICATDGQGRDGRRKLMRMCPA